jgi:uncharacterized protein DUF1549/uncharacterized protein DUF1553/cytochrome c
MSKFIVRSALAIFLVTPVALAASSNPLPAPQRKAPAKAVRAGQPAQTPATDEERARFFNSEVRSILEQKCVSCHSGEKPQGGLRLTSRDAVLKGGASGSSVSTTKPAESLLLAAVNYKGRRMPPQGKLPQKQIDVLTRWVSMGLPWPGGEQANLEPKAHHGPPQVTPEAMKFWSFRPLPEGSRRPAGPQVRRKEWVRNPIDAFVLQRLEAAGLSPNPPASKATLIRRAYYDLIGLPPSPEEVEGFVKDTSPDAWEKVVDRLLASPQYGEKWGRHWLDLVRFAESNSYERDGTKPNAWRYRDYVIKSFNEDKPYDQFIVEQLAGDELGNEGNGEMKQPVSPISSFPHFLPSTRAERLIATGYYRLGIWDDEPVDPVQALYDDLDDIVSTTGQVFLGMTVGCARCHDHKLDPIPAKDYYRLLAFFSGIRRYGVRSNESVEAASLRPIAPAEEIARQRGQIAAHRAKMKEIQDKIEAVEARILPDLIPVENEEWRTEIYRVPIVKKRVPKILSQDEFDGYVAQVEERKRLRDVRPSALDMALCVTEVGPQARETFVMLRGNPHAKGDRVEPGFLSVLAPPQPQITPPPGAETSGRRLALARWIASKENPLTARVMANRVWGYHFGRGIVRSTSNFGFQGDKPTHPELLDWLASYFVAGNGEMGKWGNGGNEKSAISSFPHFPISSDKPWSVKRLHRLIMTSAAYQMSSQANPVGLAKDPENNLFWRFDMRRLQAEEIRDSILAANGSLNLKMGGPSMYPTIPAEVLAGQSMPGAGWGRSSPEEQCRRSVYIFVKRSLMTPILAAFDGPETDFTCAQRFATTQPTQALGMLNSAWINDQAKLFAKFLREKAGDKATDQVTLGLRRVLQREPSPAEIARGVKLIESLQTDEKADAEEALAAFCLVALNLNEFVYLD